MSREWKPGDVAMINGRVCLRNGQNWEHGDARAFPYHDHQALDVRPLVVIDPEDRSAAVALAEAFRRDVDNCNFTGEDVAVMQAALREYADPTPPKPDEPLGLGGVVEDNEGRLWANLTDPTCSTHTDPWVSVHDPEQWRSYTDIAAVRVLSEGVSS